MSRNSLDQETSPYLLQHAGNPVHWRPWGDAALAEARAENKPILLSIGYAACHWCHVMAHESFEDPAIAGLMNRLYVPIKVDREERPDLDIIYQSALASLGQQGGWPLTMFLTPAGEPFWGGTYFPPTARYGRPSFGDVLTSVAEVYRQEPDKVAGNVRALLDALARLSANRSGSAPAPELLGSAAQAVLRMVDPVHGGLAGAPKFPHLPLFTLMWRAGLKNGQSELLDAVILTLFRMSHGGIYDQLGGGYARYATDESWLVPHFEKMLYDNAQMIDLLTLVWQTTRSPLFARCIDQTIGWLEREMIAEQNCFAATLDADSEGHEGKYYVWRAEEIDRLLPADLAQPFKQAYGVTSQGNWEGVNILHRNHPGAELAPAQEAGLEEARQRLLAHRRTRVPPARDDKVLADWNGMAIASLANAAFAFGRSDWLALAEHAFEGIRGHLSQGGRLAHSLRQGRRQTGAVLDDYAQMSRAALLLHEVTGVEDYLRQAEAWVATTDAHYWDDRSGGYFFTADDADGLILRTKSAHDHPTPSGNAVMVETLARLYHLTGREEYRRRADAVVAAFAGDLDQAFSSMGSLLNAWEFLDAAVQVVIVGPADDATRHLLLRTVAEAGIPTRLLQVLTPDQALPPGHPAAGKLSAAPKGSAQAYVCHGPVCLPPVSDPTALQDALGAR